MTSRIPTKIDRADDQLQQIDRDQMEAVWADLNHLATDGATPQIKREASQARLWLGRIVDRIQLATAGPLDAETPFSWNDPPKDDSPFTWREWDQADSLPPD